MPGSGVDGADGAPGDVSISQRFDVEIKILDSAQPVGQGAQQAGEFPRLALRFRHADGLEAKNLSGRSLREAPVIDRDHGRDLGIAAAGACLLYTSPSP